MESLGAILQKVVAQVGVQTPADQEIRQMMRLPSTEEARKGLATYLPPLFEGDKGKDLTPSLTARLAQCEQRDAIQATRPTGCWCLGTGATGWVKDILL